MTEQCTVLEIDASSENLWTNVRKSIDSLTTEYVVLTAKGSVFSDEDLRSACEYAEKEHLDSVMMECCYMESTKDSSQGSIRSGSIIHLKKQKELISLPDDYEAVLYRSKAVQENRPDPSHGYHVAADLFYRIAGKSMITGYIQGTQAVISHPAQGDASRNPDNRKTDWYLDCFEKHVQLTRERFAGELPLYVQVHFLRELIIRYDANKNHADKQVLKGEQLQRFWDISSEILKDIDDKLMISGTRLWSGYALAFALQEKFLHLKYKELQEKYFLVDPEQEGEGQKYPLRVQVNGRQMPNRVLPRVCIDVINYEKDKLILDCSSPFFMKGPDVRWSVLFNEKEIEYLETARYNDTAYFGQTDYRGYTFRIILKKEDFQEKNTLQFVIKGDKKKIEHPIITRRYTSRISAALDASYWCFDRYVMTFNRGNVKKLIRIETCDRWRHLRKELAFWKAASQQDKGKEKIKERIWYWLSYPYYHRKNIWLTFDKLYKGGDCGEYFYKYALTRKDTDVVPVYVMNKDAEDTQRLREEGYQPLIHGTRKHRLMFLHAKMVFATHAGLYNFNGISNEEIPYLQDLLSADAVCIQHGLSVQDLAFNANQAFNNNKLYYCASKYEVANLRKPQYGYLDSSVIRLKGLARYDGLKNRDQKQILITPTWRTYISLGAKEKNESRPYSEMFKETDYYKIYNGLITDQKLLDTARNTGYKVIYLVHPNIGEQVVDFEKKDGVEIISALGVNYEKILCESSLMVTDYSGVQFDFAYMRKPVVYYHPPKLPPHYVEGGFFYETQGFGEICTQHQELVDTLCAYMESGCALKPFYRERQDDFFAFSDHENCKRIFEDAYKWQKEEK